MADQQQTQQNNHEVDYETANNELEHREPEHHRHQQQQNGIDVPANAISETPALDNIFYDCLERIFDFLDLPSLLNVAGTCKRLQIAAATKFRHDHGNKRVNLYRNTGNSLLRYVPRIVPMEYGALRVGGLEFCFPFLRCFGAEISSLEIDYSNVLDTQKHHLDRYINLYCADTLTSFSCMNGHAFSNGNFSKPFKCVDTITVQWSDLGAQLKDFVNWFPNLQHLRMISIRIDENAIAVPFPHLKHLYISIDDNTRTDFSIENIVNLLHANPQLQTLEMYFRQFRLNQLLNVMSNSRSITNVVLDGEITERSEIELERFRSEHPSILKLELRNSIYELD